MLGAQFDGGACVGGYGLGLICRLMFGFHCFNHVAMVEAIASFYSVILFNSLFIEGREKFEFDWVPFFAEQVDQSHEVFVLRLLSLIIGFDLLLMTNAVRFDSLKIIFVNVVAFCLPKYWVNFMGSSVYVLLHMIAIF